MNEISVKQMVLAGLAMLIMWIAVAIVLQIVLEQVVGPLFLAQTAEEMHREIVGSGGQTGVEFLVNGITSLVNCTLLIWLYASLRPMYGVGSRTALIASAFGVILGLALYTSLINSGLLPLKDGLIGAISSTIELPIAMMAGAAIYENRGKWGQPAGP
jgi:hypothetical protein